jgi:hypothetical protein
VAPSEAPAATPSHAPSVAPSATHSSSEQAARHALRGLIDQAAHAYQTAANWGDFVKQCRDARGDLHRDVGQLPHHAAHMLDQLRQHGPSVGMNTQPWHTQRKLEALQRGSHQLTVQHKGFLCEEFVDLIRKGQ